MFPIHHRPPEHMPRHRRDFPVRDRPHPTPAKDGSRTLGLMVAAYIIAMLGAIGLLRILTAPPAYTALELPLRN
jgi:hypothetical protein